MGILLLAFVPVLASAQQLYDIIIQELMIDPTPIVGLPATEWIELKNRSVTPVQLQGWRLATATAISGPLPPYLLKPDSIVVLCATSSLAALQPFGPVIAVPSFPSLDNESTTVRMEHNGRVIHAIAYQRSWYRNALKQEGGWSLEMIDTRNPCNNEENWRASNDPSGGTPGKNHQDNQTFTDTRAPLLYKAISHADTIVHLYFTEPLDSATAVQSSRYAVGDLVVYNVSVLSPLYNIVQLRTDPMLQGTVYPVRVAIAEDCAGNASTGMSASIGISTAALEGDVVINEVLFNPRSPGADFIELYNRSGKVIELAELYLASRNDAGTISTPIRLSDEPHYIFPGEHIALSTAPSILIEQYPAAATGKLLRIAAMPSMPDDEGNVMVLNASGTIIEELAYTERWHFALIADPEGISLERIDPDKPANDPTNWHSAGSFAGYATPGYINSQHRESMPAEGMIRLVTPVFSPDNDGMEDYCLLDYTFPDQGWVASVSIYNERGFMVRELVNNELAGTRGNWRWDGLGDAMQPLPMGHYILLAECFHVDGRRERKKLLVVLAHRP